MEVDMPDKYIAFCRGAGRADARIPRAQAGLQRYVTSSTMDLPVSVSSTTHLSCRSYRWCAQCNVHGIVHHDRTCGKCAIRDAVIESCEFDAQVSGTPHPKGQDLFEKTSALHGVRSLAAP